MGNHKKRRIKSCRDNNTGDFDGDLVYLTDNPVILRRLEDLPALVCAQRRAEKRISTEEDFIQSNIDSFGNEIGQTTNYVTSMYEVRAGFAPESEEYRMLSYRIRCGQTYQQNAIDKAKGIVAKPMPREWRDRFAAMKIEDPATRELYMRISADRKPYFMRYVYPDLMREYNAYIRKADKNALREFGMTVGEMLDVPERERTEDQNLFLHYYNERMPVGMNDCVMNRICRRFEREFDGYVSKASASSTFDRSILKSGVGYTAAQLHAIKDSYEEFRYYVRRFRADSASERIDETGRNSAYRAILVLFEKECRAACGDEKVLCDILVDLCYNSDGTKSFAWIICGEEILSNILDANGGIINIPVRDDEGDFTYCGETYRIDKVKYTQEGDDTHDDCSE